MLELFSKKLLHFLFHKYFDFYLYRYLNVFFSFAQINFKKDEL